MRLIGRKTRGWPTLLLVAMMAIPSADPAAPKETVRDQNKPEYEVKALFVRNFLKDTRWPTSVMAKDRHQIVMGVLVPTPFSRKAEAKLTKDKVHGHRKIVLKPVRTTTDLKGLDALFIPKASDASLASSCLKSLKGKPVLTICDRSSDPGIIRMRLNSKGQVRFKIDVGQAKKVGLRIAMRLIRYADK